METERHFGRLLISPFSTRKQPYAANVLKALISICSTAKEPLFTSRIRALRQEVGRSGCQETDVCFNEVIKLINLFSKKCQDESFFYESFMLLIMLLQSAGKGPKELDSFLTDGLQRVLAGPYSVSVLSTLDGIYSGQGQDVFRSLSSLVSIDLITSAFLESLTKALTSRFDDEFDGAWQLISAIDRLVITRTNVQSNMDLILAFAKVQCVLGKISRSEAALDLGISLMERLFGCKLSFHDVDGALMSSLAELIHLNLVQQDPSSQNWIISSLTSNIRRLIPASPVDVATSGIEYIFINMARFASSLLPRFPSNPLYQIAVQFIKSFVSPKGIAKNSALCSAYVSVVLEPLYLSECEQRVQEVLIDILEHCEGVSQPLDEGYLGCLQEALKCINGQLHAEVTRPLINLVYIVSSNGLSSKRHFGTAVRYQILSFLLSVLQEHTSNLLVSQLLDAQLYPLINSLLHCRLQDHSALPFEFQCFVQEHERMILDLVALGSWVQVRSGLKSFQHFLAVYSPTATWIAYGKKTEHRQLCFEMYYRWERLSHGQFSALHKDVFAVAILHCLLNSRIDSNSMLRISEILNIQGDTLAFTRFIADDSGAVQLNGALQFLPQCIEEVEQAEWSAYSSRLCQQLVLLESKSSHIAGKVDMPMVFDAMLKKEEKVRHMCGPFFVSDLTFLASALLRVPKGRSYDNIMIVLINGLSSTDEVTYSTCLDMLVSSEAIIELLVKVIASNLEYFEPNRRFLRFAAECIVRSPQDALNHLFCITNVVPLTLKPIFAALLWIVISARIPLSVGMELVLEWIFCSEQEARLISRFKMQYRELERPKNFHVDYGLAFQQLTDPIDTLKSHMANSIGDMNRPALFLLSISLL